MAKLRVRIYNVRFGDAILISVPDRAPNGKVETRYILIDMGNVLSGAGGADIVYQPVIEDIQRTLNGRPLDLYIMTHEHLDHVQGLPYADHKLGVKLAVDYAWLTASAATDYYDLHPEARKRKMALLNEYAALSEYLAAAPEQVTPLVQALLANNNPRDTEDCVSYLRGLASKTTYVHRGCDLTGRHPFQEAKFAIWAPEEDTADYYSTLRPTAFGVQSGGGSAKPIATTPLPPAGVDAGVFYNLVELRRAGFSDNLLTIDRAANNTSVVFALEWRGWRLLFPGDAEQLSWVRMDRQGMLQPTHFLKVGHHGSFNGTPLVAQLDKILPKKRPDRRKRSAVVSTYPNTYGGVPDAETLKMIEERCQLRSVEGLPDGGYVDVEFAGR
jgi:hypothetical protein